MATVQAVAGDDTGRVVAATAILLLHPLCLRAARVTAATSWLDRHGFRITYCRRVRMTDDHVRRIWKYQKLRPDPRRVRLVSEMLTFAPALVIAVVDEAPTGESATSRLRVLKGPADPCRAAPDHLRTHLGAANMFNNLVHTCDGPGELLRETAALLGADVSRFWRNSALALRQPLRDVGARVPRDIPTPVPDGISLTHVAVRLRRLLLPRLRLSVASLSGHVAASLEERIDREAAWVGAQDPARPVATLAGYQQVFRPVSLPLQAITESDSDRASQRAAISTFAEIERALFSPSFDAEALEERAVQAGLPLSRRDRLVFSTQDLSSRYCGDRRNAPVAEGPR
jgi:nucleoside diphosphate kinase